MFTRRTFIGAGAGATVLAACGGSDKAAASKNSIAKVGIQTYTLRKAMAEDFRGTLQMIKDVGYDYVEINERNFTDYSPAELRAMLDDIGLPAPSTHMSMSKLFEDPQGLADTCKTLGCEYGVIPYIAEDQRTLDDWKRHAKVLERAGRVFADNGIKLAYHNHQFEFDDLGGGTTALDVLMNDADSEVLDFELDFFWANLAGINVPDLIRKYTGRFALCHIKDMKGDAKTINAKERSYEEITTTIMVDVGKGEIDFEQYFAMNDISGMKYFIAEHDNPTPPYRDAVAFSLNSIRNMRF